MAVEVKFKDLTFIGGEMVWASGTITALNKRRSHYSVKENGNSTVYSPLDRGAGPIIKELAAKAGIEVKSSWDSAKVAEMLLKQVLGSDYIVPKRGETQTIFNHAIIDGYLVEHIYENDGCGWENSIKRYAYIYVK